MGLTRPVVLRAILHAMLVSTARGAFDVIDEGKGTPLVLVHGFPFDNASWRADARELAPGMRVLAPSMRGFGGSVPFDGIAGASSIDAMADDVAGVLDALAITESVVMGGLSMGGYVALAFARRHGARLRGLVLADTRAEPDSDETRANRDKAIARVEGGDLVGYVDGLLATILGATTRAEHPAIVESARAMAMRADPAAVVQALRAMRDRPDARPGLATIAVPVLIVVGEEDVLIPPAASEAMASALGKATVHVLRRAGHLANLEQPEAFREVVAGFVGRV
jgi:3-oxoadipate enol-lactonase